MVKFSYNRQLIEKFPFYDFKVKVPHKQVEYLTQYEIDTIERKQILNDRLATIRDIFIFSVYSGLSFREMKNLHKRHLKIINGEYWIDMIRQKTQKQYTIPLLPKCVQILERYNKHPKTTSGLLLPLPSNQKFNAYLKEIQHICEIDTVITCHLARRTFGSTILLQNNVNIHVISQMMGHSNTSVTIKSYLGTNTQMMVNEFERIKDIYSK
jgi:integrase